MKSNRYLVFIVSIVICILDQLIKQLIMQKITFGFSIPVISGVLSITKVYNTGAAFSLLQSHTFALAIFSIIFAVSLIIYFAKKSAFYCTPFLAAWGLVLGGTMGNLIDRAVRGFVVDFISLDFIHFPIFNIADMAINIGAVIILVYVAFGLEKIKNDA